MDSKGRALIWSEDRGQDHRAHTGTCGPTYCIDRGNESGARTPTLTLNCPAIPVRVCPHAGLGRAQSRVLLPSLLQGLLRVLLLVLLLRVLLVGVVLLCYVVRDVCVGDGGVGGGAPRDRPSGLIVRKSVHSRTLGGVSGVVSATRAGLRTVAAARNVRHGTRTVTEPQPPEQSQGSRPQPTVGGRMSLSLRTCGTGALTHQPRTADLCL